jgi:hypothetical protein
MMGIYGLPARGAGERRPAGVFEVKVDRITALVELVLEGRVLAEEMERFLGELKEVLVSLQGRDVKIKADVRGFSPVAPEVAEMIRKGQEYALGLGVKRMAYVVESDLVALQLNRLARESGTGKIMRCFWDEAEAVEWLLHSESAPSSKNPSNRPKG